jgi:putative membrane protein
MLKKIFIHWLIVLVALIVAAALLPGIEVQDTSAWIVFALMAAVLALVNAIIRPILSFLSCGCIIATLGLFKLVINAFTLWLSAQIAQSWFGIGFYVDGFLPAILGGIIVSVVSFLLSLVLYGGED